MARGIGSKPRRGIPRENLSQDERARLRRSVDDSAYMEKAFSSIAESLLGGQRSLMGPGNRLVLEREQKLRTALRIRANILAARASNVKGKDGV